MQRWTSICKPHTYTNMHKTIYMQTCTMWWLAHLSSSYSKTFKVISPWKMMGKLWFRCGRALAFCWQSKICGTLVCGSLLHELLFIHWSIYQVLTYKLKWKKWKVSTADTVCTFHAVYFIFDGFFALLSVLENRIVGPFTVPVVLWTPQEHLCTDWKPLSVLSL